MTSRQRETAEALRQAPGARFTVHVSGTSMAPSLREGDELRVERTSGPDGCSLGDLVAIVRPDVGLVVHRLLWTGSTHVRTRGDGSGLMDVPIAREDVLGRVTSARRDGVEVLPGTLARRIAWARHFSIAGARWAQRHVARLTEPSRRSRADDNVERKLSCPNP